MNKIQHSKVNRSENDFTMRNYAVYKESYDAFSTCAFFFFPIVSLFGQCSALGPLEMELIITLLAEGSDTCYDT